MDNQYSNPLAKIMENQYSTILEALTQASSQNAELLKSAEHQLRIHETTQGFHSILLNIACDTNNYVNIRWLSVLCLKNGVDRHWRKSVYNLIPNDEKNAIRQKLLTCLNEPVNQIALQFAVITSKIARHDFPKDWPDLFPTLLNASQSADELLQLRGLLTINHVVKALSSKRLTFDRRTFQQLTGTIFTTIFHQWLNYSKFFLQGVNGDFSKRLLDCSLLSLKILRKLVAYGFKDCSQEPDAVNFLSLIYQQIGPFLDCKACLQSKGNAFDTCEKYTVLLVKVLRDVLELQPFAFVQFIRPTLECCITFCFNKSFEDKLFEKLIVQFMNLVKSILLCQEYKTSKLIKDTTNPLTVEAQKTIVEFFTYPVLREIFDQMFSRYLLLTSDDIYAWENSPEEFASVEGGESWKFSLRPCTETFFMAVFHEFRSLLTPLIVETLQNIQNINSSDFLGVLKKDAVYNIVGLAAFDLYDDIDFDNWLQNVLISELQNKQPRYYIIRRRVIWLIGVWVGVKMSHELRPLMYEITLQLLNFDEDLVVRLTASNALKVAIDDFDFCPDQFFPFLESSIASLYNLLKEVKECDLKMSILHVLSFIIERMGTEVRPFVEALMHYLPQLWENCGEHNMLRCAIITCFVHLVQGLGTMSESIHPFLIPMIALSTDVSQPPHVYLMEDGLDLWWAVLDNTSKYSEELLAVAANIFPLLEYKGASLPICLKITEAYIILATETFLKRYGQILVGTLNTAVKDMKTEGIKMVLKVVETVFILFPEDGPVLFQPMLPYVVTLALDKDETPICFGCYISVLSRVILHNQTCFGRVLQEKANEVNKDVGALLGECLDLWLKRIINVNPVQRRKMFALAMTCLLTSNSDVVYERICGIFLVCCETLHDISVPKSETQKPIYDTLILMGPEEISDEDGELETEQDRRKRELTSLDPVYKIVLRDYLYNQVMALQQSVGATKFQDLMSTVDCETMKQLQGYLNI